MTASNCSTRIICVSTLFRTAKKLELNCSTRFAFGILDKAERKKKGRAQIRIHTRAIDEQRSIWTMEAEQHQV